MSRYLAVGDSFTEGMCDDVGADGHYRGWADRVAEALASTIPGLGYANLAVRGKLLDQVVVEQLPLALEQVTDPTTTLVTFHAGANDVLRPRVDVDHVLARYDRAVALLARGGVRVLLFTAVTRTGGSGRTSDRLADRFGRFNDGVRATADRYGTLLQDNGAVPALQDRRLWAADRLHLAPEGHRRVAAGVLELLGVTDAGVLGGAVGWWQEPLPAAPATGRGTALAADAQWLRTHLLPWVGRRLRGVSSGDGRVAKRPTAAPLATGPDGIPRVS